MNIVAIVKIWTVIKPIKRIKEFRNREKKVFKGKLTYAAIAAVVAPVVARLLGIDVPESELVAIFQAVAALVGVYGRYRATK